PHIRLMLSSVHSLPTRRSSALIRFVSDLGALRVSQFVPDEASLGRLPAAKKLAERFRQLRIWSNRLKAVPIPSRHHPLAQMTPRSEEHTSELQSLRQLVCRLLL